MTKEECIFMEHLCHLHQIGCYHEHGIAKEENGEMWSVFGIAYYRFEEPNMLVMSLDLENIFIISLDKLDCIRIIKGYVSEKSLNTIREHIEPFKDYYIKEFFDINPNYSKYRKIWRKYKNKWFKKLSYKSVPKEQYYEWQRFDRWFYSSKDIEESIAFNKKHGYYNGGFGDEYANPNIVGYYFDGEPLKNIDLSGYSEEQIKKYFSGTFECSERNYVEYKGRKMKFIHIS